jgi:hypothetical protein
MDRSFLNQAKENVASVGRRGIRNELALVAVNCKRSSKWRSTKKKRNLSYLRLSIDHQARREFMIGLSRISIL